MLKNERLRRGIYILPNIFTSLNLFCGFYAIISSINGKFVPAAVAILIAGIFDALDGKIARATNTTSKFGIEYDSLADLISFREVFASIFFVSIGMLLVPSMWIPTRYRLHVRCRNV